MTEWVFPKGDYQKWNQRCFRIVLRSQTACFLFTFGYQLGHFSRPNKNDGGLATLDQYPEYV